MPFFIAGAQKLRIGATPDVVQIPFPHAHPAIAPTPADIAMPLRNSRLFAFIGKSFLLFALQIVLYPITSV
jgi:hypothetical protein